MSNRTIIAKIELDENTMIKNQECNGLDDVGDIEYLYQEFGWLEESGLRLIDARIVDDDP